MNINPDTRPFKRKSRRTRMWATVAGIILVFYGLWYWFQPLSLISIPFGEYWDDKVADLIILLASISAAALSQKMARHFTPSEPPYRIWTLFSTGMRCWVGGEALGFIYDHFYWYQTFPDYTVPEFTLMDVCWTFGYFFLGLSLYQQFRLIYSSRNKHQTLYYYLAFVVAILLIAFGLTELGLASGLGEDVSRGGVFLAILYPVFDLFQGSAALWLFFLFRRGWLGRPWWGLLLFAFADAISAIDWLGGFENISDQAYYYWYLLSALAYLAGYMVTALAFMAADDHLNMALHSDRPAPQ
jgi:hypothetical protein